jgi:hypothetical protein
MKRKLSFSLALLAILMIVSATSMPTLATTYQLGVQAGNTADYNAAISISSNVTKAHMSVRNATGTVAGLALTFSFSNGTLYEPLSIYPLIDVASTNGSNGA